MTHREAGKQMAIHTILIVDDSPTERYYLNQMLVRAGYAVTMAEDGADALAQLKQSRPDLILMDVVMPGANGFQITRAIARDPQLQDVPVIICSSKSQETDRIWGLRQGARDYLVKPVVEAELLAKIAALSALS